MNAARMLARALLTATVTLTLGAASATLAQEAASADGAAASGADATNADEPRRARDRRRSGRATDESQAPEAVPAAADAAATALTAQQPETVEARIVCKNVKLTGTKISKRICGTPEQWAAQSQKTTGDAQEAMRQVRDRSSIVVSQPESPLGGLGGN